jgi:hypothetical protein
MPSDLTELGQEAIAAVSRGVACCVGTTATPFRRGARGLQITAQIELTI